MQFLFFPPVITQPLWRFKLVRLTELTTRTRRSWYWAIGAEMLPTLYFILLPQLVQCLCAEMGLLCLWYEKDKMADQKKTSWLFKHTWPFISHICQRSQALLSILPKSPVISGINPSLMLPQSAIGHTRRDGWPGFLWRVTSIICITYGETDLEWKAKLYLPLVSVLCFSIVYRHCMYS